MADKDLIQLDKDITKAILKDADAWRNEFANVKAHAVYLEIKEVKKQVWLEMVRREGYRDLKTFIKERPKQVKKLKKAVDKPIEQFMRDYWALVKKKSKNKKSFNILFDAAGTDKAFSFAVYQATDESKDIFKFIKSIKADPQRPLIWAINNWSKDNSRRGEEGGVELSEKESKYVRSQGRTMGKQAEGEIQEWEKTNSNDSFVDFGHVGDSAVGTQRALHAADLLKNYSGAGKAAAKKILKELQKTFGFIYETETDYAGQMERVLRVTLESSRFNKATMDKGEVTNLQRLIDQALGKVEVKRGSWAFQKGSDSFFNMAQKKICANIASHLENNPKAKIITKIKYKNRKNEKRTVEGKKLKRKIKTVKGPAYRLPPISTRKEARQAKMGGGSATSPLAMIGLINKELPAVVESNMGRPRLESITGRLAGSARVTDIITTAQGFPSIGYTYQLDPYQTFETGGKQGSTDYDPRRLIDQSLRQIAIKFAMGRFYTRREQ